MYKNLITYSIFSFLIISFFGFNFLFSFLGNILIILFLTPFLLIGIAFLGINSFKSKFKVCKNCGASMISEGGDCLYCGTNYSCIENNNEYSDNASSETIEIEAEEVN